MVQNISQYQVKNMIYREISEKNGLAIVQLSDGKRKQKSKVANI